MTADQFVETSAQAFTETFESADPTAVDRLGGKGAGLARMTQGGLRVPPGFVISTDACRGYLASEAMPAGVADEVLARVAELEDKAGKTFGHGPHPLLVSVRSGAPVSMPGMMDTILNLGLGRDAAIALAEAAGDTRFMAELTARFHAMYSEIVLGALDAEEGVRGVVEQIRSDDPPGEAYDRVWAACEQALADDTGDSVPADPRAQLLAAVEAVFRSWNTRRARTYRDFHGIPHDMGTAVVVQSMVFGNLGTDSGSGVVFTRNPVTGEAGLFGEYLANSQGEDVVAGTRTPDPVAVALAADLFDELASTSAALEAEHGDVLDIEFTVERGTLYFLQVRLAKRTPEAAVRIAADLLTERTITARQAVRLVTPEQVRQVQRPGFDDSEVDKARAGDRLLTTGTGACPGQVSGVLVVDPDRAKSLAEGGTPVILARAITSPADLHGMIAAQGLVTATGGSTSHAAVVARALGTACVVGASAMRIDEGARTLTIGDRALHEGELISLDGATGELFVGGFATSTPAAANSALARLLGASEATDCEVLARISTAGQVAEARDAGAPAVVCSVNDVLAAAGLLNEVHIRFAGEQDETATTSLRDAVAEAFTPLFAAIGTGEVIVHALDLLAPIPGSETDQQDLLEKRPGLALPLGVPAVVEAQLAGIASAIERAGCPVEACLLLHGISDAGEVEALRSLAEAPSHRVGACLSTIRGLVNGSRVSPLGTAIWADLQRLQAELFGWSPLMLTSPGPLDEYVERGVLTEDPRQSVDPFIVATIGQLNAPETGPWVEAGVVLTGQVDAAVAEPLHRAGVRRYAVDVAEVRPLLLALARAHALSDG